MAKMPCLFAWWGPEDEGRLSAWAREKRGCVPEDLFRWWSIHGGGELFETETLLSPFGNPAMGDDVDATTQIQHAKGLSSNWTVFHVGFGFSAFDLNDAHFAWFQRHQRSPSAEFDSLEAWYKGILRKEYAERYGL